MSLLEKHMGKANSNMMLFITFEVKCLAEFGKLNEARNILQSMIGDFSV